MLDKHIVGGMIESVKIVRDKMGECRIRANQLRQDLGLDVEILSRVSTQPNASEMSVDERIVYHSQHAATELFALMQALTEKYDTFTTTTTTK